MCLQSKPLAAFVDGNFLVSGFKAHLSTSSNVSRSSKNMVLTKLKEAKTNTISLPDDDPHAVHQLIKFLYTTNYDVLNVSGTTSDSTNVETLESN
jgi:hypothetical protein